MIRKLSDIKDIFLNTDGVSEDTVIYSFDNIIPNDNSEDLLHGETVLYPGQVNGEFFMTKGHRHNVASAEVYYGLEGEAIVLCENEDDIYEEVLTAGSVVYCKPNYAHRVINKSNSPCRFFCVCRADAGHDYSVVFSKRYMSDKN